LPLLLFPSLLNIGCHYGYYVFPLAAFIAMYAIAIRHTVIAMSCQLPT
jgi:hypothetical protein